MVCATYESLLSRASGEIALVTFSYSVHVLYMLECSLHISYGNDRWLISFSHISSSINQFSAHRYINQMLSLINMISGTCSPRFLSCFIYSNRKWLICMFYSLIFSREYYDSPITVINELAYFECTCIHIPQQINFNILRTTQGWFIEKNRVYSEPLPQKFWPSETGIWKPRQVADILKYMNSVILFTFE